MARGGFRGIRNRDEGSGPVPTYDPVRPSATTGDWFDQQEVSGGQVDQRPMEAAQSPQDFILQWQQTHPASEGIGPLAAALQAAGYTDVSRFMYGATPSNNELVVNGQKFKVLAGENSSNPSWYLPGMDDGGGGEQGAPFQPAPAWGETFQGPAWDQEFQAPDKAALLQDPGYQERLARGQQALERSASAKGTLLTGGTLKDLTDYAQGSASQEYGQVYGRKLNEYLQNYQQYQNKYAQSADEYNRRYQQYLDAYGLGKDTFMTNYGVARNAQGDLFNQQYSLAQLGLQGAQGASQAGQNYASGGSESIYGGANANAAGQVGSANAWNAGISGAVNTGIDLYALNRYGNPSAGRRAMYPTPASGYGSYY